MTHHLDVPATEATRQQAEEIIRAWRAKRAERLEADKVAAALKEDESAMKQWIIEVFRAQAFEGMVTDKRITGVATKKMAVVDDREVLIDYIYKNRAIDILQFRLSQTAIDERVDQWEAVPGIRTEEFLDIYDRKA